jgi:hypothetical protein
MAIREVTARTGSDALRATGGMIARQQPGTMRGGEVRFWVFERVSDALGHPSAVRSA